MSPWAQAVYDTLGALVSPAVTDEIASRGLIEVLPLTHIRGRSLHDSFVIVDEAQSLERNVLLTVLSRRDRPRMWVSGSTSSMPCSSTSSITSRDVTALRVTKTAWPQGFIFSASEPGR